MFFNKYLKKGHYGYIKRLSKITFIITFVILSISLALFIFGIITTGTNKNYFSIFSILLILPMAKFMVIFIMTLKFKKMNEDIYKKITNIDNNGISFYDLFFTSGSINVNINSFFIDKNDLYIYTEDKKLDIINAINMIRLDAYKDNIFVTDFEIFIYKDVEKYINMLKEKSDSFLLNEDLKLYLINKSL